MEEGRIDDAVPRYQRAIYGTWPEKQLENRFQARIELIDALEKAGRRLQAQAELLSAAAAIPGDDGALKKQVGRMLIDYGLAKNAESLFRDVAQRNPQDADALQGLGDAEFANGDYAAARDAYRASLALDPANSAVAKRADLCERILALDPDLRGLSGAQRYARSLKILSGVMVELARCGGNGDNVALQKAQAALARKRRPDSYIDAADSNRALAAELWSARPPSCAAAGGDDALNRVMAR
jgi:tetratricopeptide (TPR) repeat protein